MKTSFALLALAGTATAFAPTTPLRRAAVPQVALRAEEEAAAAEAAPADAEGETAEADAEGDAPAVAEAEPEAEVAAVEEVAVGVDLGSMAGSTKPIKNFDPLNLATVGSAETLAWFRAAELKHCRVAMLASTGYIVQSMGYHFPGQLSDDVSFESLSAMKPFAAWDGVPDAGKAQILFTCFVAELASESQGTHYMKGGETPEVVFPKFDFSNVDADVMRTKRNRELNNGRLAMIGIMGFIAANNIPGSVPALAGLEAFQ